jgi:Outer membrane protein beta-barrel domain
MRTLFLFLFSILSLTCMGQVKIDVVAGPNLATFVGADVVAWGELSADPTMSIKYHAGVTVNFTVNELLSIEPGVFYSLKGPWYKGTSRFFEPAEDVSIIYKKRLGYLEFPVMARFRVDTKIDLFSGPKFSHLLSAEVKNDASDADLAVLGLDKTSDVKDDYKTFDLAWVIGVTYKVLPKLSVHGAYDIGLTNIGKVENPEAVVAPDYHTVRVRNNVFKISVSYRIKE